MTDTEILDWLERESATTDIHEGSGNWVVDNGFVRRVAQPSAKPWRRQHRRMVMAHECPDCYQICYCGGDIDDCEFNDEHTYVNCSHYTSPDCDAHWEMEDEDDY